MLFRSMFLWGCGKCNLSFGFFTELLLRFLLQLLRRVFGVVEFVIGESLSCFRGLSCLWNACSVCTPPPYCCGSPGRRDSWLESSVVVAREKKTRRRLQNPAMEKPASAKGSNRISRRVIGLWEQLVGEALRAQEARESLEIGSSRRSDYTRSLYMIPCSFQTGRTSSPFCKQRETSILKTFKLHKSVSLPRDSQDFIFSLEMSCK